MFAATMTTRNKLLIPANLKQNNLDLLRQLLAIFVLYSHCYIIFFGTMDREPVKIFSGGQTELGTLSVYCFFIISGFLIVRSFQNSKSRAGYFNKRLLRIVPGFVVAVLASVFIAGPLGTTDAAFAAEPSKDYFSSLPLPRFAVELVTLQMPEISFAFNTLPVPGVPNGSLWTIQHEVLCYLAVPLLAAIGLFRKKYLLPVAFVLAFGTMLLLQLPQLAYYHYVDTHLVNFPGYLPTFLVYFLAGAFCYLKRESLVRRKWLAIAAILLIAITARFGGFNIVFPFAGTYLLFYIAFHPTILYPHFARRGDLSYGTYLYAWPVQQLVLFYFGAALHFNLFFILSLAFTLVVAWLSWHLVERPFLQLKKAPQVKPAPLPHAVA